MVFGDYKWTEFDDYFLTNNVQSIAVVDTELKLKERQVLPYGLPYSKPMGGVEGCSLLLLNTIMKVEVTSTTIAVKCICLDHECFLQSKFPCIVVSPFPTATCMYR